MSVIMFMVSVPLQGTYLPYEMEEYKSKILNAFPSPYRGLIFLTYTTPGNHSRISPKFPSPYRGLIFLTLIAIRQILKQILFPSPYRGLIFLTQKSPSLSSSSGKVSVPLQGTYLPYGLCRCKAKVGNMFPSPYRGLIFLTEYLLFLKLFYKFPSPYRGLIFLTERTGKAYTRTQKVSVPLQGTYLPYTA